MATIAVVILTVLMMVFFGGSLIAMGIVTADAVAPGVIQVAISIVTENGLVIIGAIVLVALLIALGRPRSNGSTDYQNRKAYWD